MNIVVKEVSIDNAKLLFDWANDSVTRHNSFNPNPIEWKSHVSWLKRKIADPNAHLFLTYLNKIPIGTIRFESKDNTEISVTVAPSQRGKGNGAKIIKAACNRFMKNSNQAILAYIKKDNPASKRVFEKAGFVFYKEDIYNSKACFVLILRKNEN